MPKLKVAVLIDGDCVPRFGLLALDAIKNCDEITVFSCTNTRIKRDVLRHGAYYALNLVSVRNALTARVSINEGRNRIAGTTSFEADYQGSWQALPDAVVAEIRAGGFDVVIKLGMYLLKVPPSEQLATPILSFHHGDPDAYRGRPAGFWETVHRTPVMGQMIQIISNKLDAGKVVAYGETKVLPHSYRATLINAYQHSYLLINKAISNALAGTHLGKACTGKNYRLPSNLTVARFVLMVAFRFVKRLLYGAFMEKQWKVSKADLADLSVDDLLHAGVFPAAGDWRTFPTKKHYTFYADPFFSSQPEGVLVEALNRRTGLGEIVLIDQEGHKLISAARGHLSYPFTFEVEGRQLVLPEAASWSAPRLYAIENGALTPLDTLRIEPPARVTDPTMIEHEGRFYLFGNNRDVGPNVLFIWSADSLDSTFTIHPDSPALISPRGARMGGAPLRLNGRLLRFGQDFISDYGDGVSVFEVETMSATEFRERPLGRIKFERIKGPHTLNVRDGQILFDWYRHGFSLLAAPRRLLAQRRAQSLATDRTPPVGAAFPADDLPTSRPGPIGQPAPLQKVQGLQ